VSRVCHEQNSGRTTLDLEKAIRSAAYLMIWGLDTGNDGVPAPLAWGLSEVLDRCADDLHGRPREV